MRCTLFCFGLLVFVYLPTASVAAAQEKISGTAQCAKPDPQHIVPVGGMAGHSLAVEQSKCTWTKPMEIAGSQTKDGVSTSTGDIGPHMARGHGYHVTTMTNGDTWSASYSDTSRLSKDGPPESTKGTWVFLGGTGKLKGIKGKGTFECKPAGDAVSCDIEGEYTLPK
jgi:hypothetical protein